MTHTDFPINEDLERFRTPHTPESFTTEEKKLLQPFFTNLDKPIFVVKNLPSEVKGALASRYSRSTKSLRRVFLTEYLFPIIHPEMSDEWENLSATEKKSLTTLKNNFFAWHELITKQGGIEEIVNVQRGRAFFDKWLSQYGDDSIAELGAELICLEGISNIAAKEIEDKRIGLSPLEKSTRYVQFWEKRSDGKYQYVVPGEIRGKTLEKQFTRVMDGLFDVYSQIAPMYLEYIKTLYPKGDDETDKSFTASRGAKRFDDIRDLLPFATQTNVAVFGNGRAFEDVINRLVSHNLGELRYIGQSIAKELSLTVPSFVKRSVTERGAQAQLYRRNLSLLKKELVRTLVLKKTIRPKRWVELVEKQSSGDISILASFLFREATGTSMHDISAQVKKLSQSKRKELFMKILSERKMGRDDFSRQEDRFHKVPRAFENASYVFEFWGRGSAYRDLQRHRQSTQDRQLFTMQWGYDVDADFATSPFFQQVVSEFKSVEKLCETLAKKNPEVAQYIVPFAYIQHWYMRLTAREIYWIVELRTGPQGHPHYREICQQLADAAMKADPVIFQGLLVDRNSYAIARRESEKKIDKKLKNT